MLFFYILGYSLIVIALIFLSLGIYSAWEIHSSGWSNLPIVRQKRIFDAVRWFTTLWCLVSGILLLLHISWSLIAIKLYSIYWFILSLLTLVLRFVALISLTKDEDDSLLIDWKKEILGNVFGFIIMAAISVALFWASQLDSIKIIVDQG